MHSGGLEITDANVCAYGLYKGIWSGVLYTPLRWYRALVQGKADMTREWSCPHTTGRVGRPPIPTPDPGIIRPL